MPYNPRGEAILRARIALALERATDAATEYLQDALDHEGSGIHWAGLPRRSSAEGEYPSLQSGALWRSIASRQDGPLSFSFGSINGPAHAHYLEFRPVSEQLPGSGIRAWGTKALHDPGLHAAFRNALRR